MTEFIIRYMSCVKTPKENFWYFLIEVSVRINITNLRNPMTRKPNGQSLNQTWLYRGLKWCLNFRNWYDINP